jgi:hypothetical protein
MSRFEAEWDKGLSIALLSKDTLQNSLNASKHDASAVSDSNSLTVRKILYGSTSPTRTICIHLNNTVHSVLYLWYSMSKVYIRDICSSIESLEGSYMLHFSQVKLDLYVLNIAEVCNGLNVSYKVHMVFKVANSSCIEVRIVPQDIMLRCVRESPISSHSDEWEVFGKFGEIYSVFNGDKYKHLYPYCDTTLSTDLNITVRYIGKAKAAILYKQHIKGDNVDIYLSKMLSTRAGEVSDYNSMSRSDPIKRMTIRDQMSGLVQSALNQDRDSMILKESRLMVGLNIGSHDEDDKAGAVRDI